MTTTCPHNTLIMRNILDELNRLAPWYTAETWDNVGLILGRSDQKITHILCALEVTPAVVKEARRRRCNLIIVHHPIIFKPLSRIDYAHYPGSLLRELIRHDIHLIAIHTNLDKSLYGTNYALAERIGLHNCTFLSPDTVERKAVKLVVFVPEGHEGKVIEAISSGGGGIIGNYSHCTFRSKGTGTFKPLARATPFIGQKGNLEEVQEYRLESIVPCSRIHQVVREMLEAHPYEETAYDIIPLEETDSSQGLGCIGTLESPVSLSVMASRLKRLLNSKTIKIIGSPDTIIRKIAICTGAADSVISMGQGVSADVFIVGEINHHTAVAASINALNVLVAGHYETEIVGMLHLRKILSENPLIQSAGVRVVTATHQSSPFSRCL